MQKKATLLLAVTGVALAGAIWFGWMVINEGAGQSGGDGSGPTLHIDVVAPNEPEAIHSDGKLGVGELTDNYDHSQTMAPPASAQDADGYTTFDDPAWNATEGTGITPQDKRVYNSDPASANAKIPGE